MGDELTYTDGTVALALPLPCMQGAHQHENAALAVAIIRHQRVVRVSPEAIALGIESARWPARLQYLGDVGDGPLCEKHEVWVDGGHNPSAAGILAEFFAGDPTHLIVGMIKGKDPAGFMQVLGDFPASMTVVPVPNHESVDASAFGPGARAATDVPSALAALPDDGLPVLIAGSLYLAGEVLRLNGELPD